MSNTIGDVAMKEHYEYANGLRALADWIESHQDVALPNDEISIFSLNTKEEAAHLIKQLKPCKKTYSEDMFYVSRDFGPISLRAVFYRKEVCVRRVAGQQVIPEHTEPETVIPARVVKEHIQDVYEWDCKKALLDFPEESEAEHEPV